MENNKLYKPNAIDLILGKCIIHEDSNLQDVAVMYFKRYKIVVEAGWLNNIGLFSPSIRTVAYTPKEVIKRNDGIAGYNILNHNRKELYSVLENFNYTDYYTVLNVAIEIARLYLLRVIIYQDNDEILNLIKGDSYYDKIIGLIDVLDEPIASKCIRDRIVDEINYSYITGSIIWELTEYIKTNGYETT